MPWLLLVLAVLAEMGEACKDEECCFQKLPSWEGGSGSVVETPRELCCYRIFPSGYECSWQYDGDPTDVTHFLWCCFRNGDCCYFEAGKANRVSFTDQAKVHTVENVTFSVESRVGNWTTTSPNITLVLYWAFKFDPPNEEMTVSKIQDQFLIKWEIPEGQNEAIVEYRYRTWNGTWEQGDCGAQENSDFENCSLQFKAPVAYEIQLRRHKRASPTSQWSDWSKSICIPAEIPELNYTVGKLNNDGKRDLIFDWEPRQVRQPQNCMEEVSFSLVLQMLSCTCKPKSKKKMSLEKVIQISGAEYNVTIRTQGTLGPQLNRTFHIPADPNSGFIQDAEFLNISTSEDNMTMQWFSLERLVKSYCIEWYPHAANWTNAACALKSSRKEKDGRKVIYSRDKALGIMDLLKCYRINIYASDQPKNPQSWVTVFSGHHFSGDVLKAGPSNLTVKTRAHEVSLEWNPSPISKCPGVLKNYVISCWNGKNNKTIFFKPEISFSIGDETSHSFPFLPLALGIFAAIIITAVSVYYVLKRVKSYLCPPLPNPSISKATKFLEEDWKPIRPWIGASETVEDVGTREPLIIEVNSPKVGPEVGSEVRLLCLEEPKELPDTKEKQMVGGNDPPVDIELASDYKRQNHMEVVGDDGPQDTRDLSSQDDCDTEKMVPLFISPEAQVPARITLSFLSVRRPSETSENLKE
ncbi:interleukin-12 receptor subunit beta-1 [Gracilinanus agilis]|uniref:interleukin-12 receptor subunit beta-1 n=1 Tax=Gracilinanus agilis TaxID=191870 RepID=UPI001CFDE372|nr:interleukin-12 receptor subunit beta-1 [Gracilinanus agilis]